MKKLPILFVIITCLSFQNNKPKKFIPPGTVQINETFFADETEISNLSWREYESWIKSKYGQGSKEHLQVLPDTLVWRDTSFYNEPYTIHYYRHVAYKDYPVVGISYEQVLAFCKWRTERVKEYYMIRYKKELAIEYRLPSKEEWNLISNNGLEIFSDNGRDQKGVMKLNCALNPADSTTEGSDVTAPVYSYYKNNFGIFNTSGNVSEMILESGISKGGSWKHNLEECKPDKDIQYDKPQSWLGFRCVCVLKQTS